MTISIYLTDQTPKLFDASFINNYEDLKVINSLKERKEVTIIGVCNPRLLFVIQQIWPSKIDINIYFPFIMGYKFFKSLLDLGDIKIYCSPNYYLVEMEAFNFIYIKLHPKNHLSTLARQIRLRIVQHPDYTHLTQYLKPNFDFPLKCLVPPMKCITRHSIDKEFIRNCNAYIKLLKHGISAAKPHLSEDVPGLNPKINIVKKLIKEYPQAICVIQDDALFNECFTFTHCIDYNSFLNQRLTYKIFKILILVDVPFAPIFRIYGSNKCFVLLTEPEQTELNLNLKDLATLSKFNGKVKTVVNNSTRTLAIYNQPLVCQGASIEVTPIKSKPLILNSAPTTPQINNLNKINFSDTPVCNQRLNTKRVIESETPIKIRVSESETPVKLFEREPKFQEFLNLEASCSDKRTDSSFSVLSNTQDRDFIANTTALSSDIGIYRELHSTPQYKKMKFKPILVTQSECSEESGSIAEFVQDDILFSSDYLKD
eukprot:NODE_637_length_5728_cov_0.215669.p2 type:complete len:485 gc:universal NODE_637_length_5728_cov_0.215669:5615-4161(-)